MVLSTPVRTQGNDEPIKPPTWLFCPETNAIREGSSLVLTKGVNASAIVPISFKLKLFLS